MPAPDSGAFGGPWAADLALLTEAAVAGGRIAMARRASGFETWEKDGGAGPVTEADLEIDRALHAELTGARPDYGWLSEETEDDAARLAAERVFIVDPIDGTRAYASGGDDFGVAAAVVERGRAVAAVVVMPALGHVLQAALGEGARCDGAPLGLAPHSGEAEGARVLASGAGLRAERWPGGVPPVKRSFRASLAWRLCLVARGDYDASLSLGGVWEWDAAAPGLIAAEAGASVVDALGAPPVYNRPEPRLQGLIACAPALLPAFLSRLAPAA
ncbi:MAG: 3'(2'),5'-bisphosphate nucleotidase CysQ [Pseudomonadota bacterium]